MPVGPRLATSLALAALLVGCAPSEPGAATEAPAIPAETSSASPDELVELVGVTVDEWRQDLAALRGEIVVVDLWATWCIPCIERFPHMVELYHRYRDRRVTFVSVSLDDPGDELAIDYARRFLREQNATFANYLITENTADAFEKLDLLTIPAVFIYGADGELRKRLTADDPNSQFTDQDVENAILELLGDRAAA